MKRILTITKVVDQLDHVTLRYSARVFQQWDGGFVVIRRHPNGENDPEELHYFTSDLAAATSMAHQMVVNAGLPDFTRT